MLTVTMSPGMAAEERRRHEENQWKLSVLQKAHDIIVRGFTGHGQTSE